MKILLTGSSGFIGRHIHTALEEAGHDVIAVSRKTGFNFNQMTQVADWLPQLQSVNIVINCVGIIVETKQQRFDVLHTLAPSALFRACEQSGIDRVIQISALGADDSAFTSYQLSKKAADDVLRSMSYDWFILRPSLVYGEDGASTSFFKKLASFPVLFLVDGGRQQIQPVHIDDLVNTVIACLTIQPAKQTIDIVGPRAMSFADWLKQLRQQMSNSPVRIFSVPFSLALVVAHLLHHIFPLLHPDNLRILRQGNTSSNSAMEKLIGRMPRDVP